ncbi:MAG TPA: hypothetical protein GX530_10335 [Corynebacteriales bacterium]|nr:hypothetical protein [Mycobacteriales bacterium]
MEKVNERHWIEVMELADIEEVEEQLFRLTIENLELHRKIRVGLEAEKQLRNNQKALDSIAEMYLELRKNQLNKGDY